METYILSESGTMKVIDLETNHRNGSDTWYSSVIENCGCGLIESRRSAFPSRFPPYDMLRLVARFVAQDSMWRRCMRIVCAQYGYTHALVAE